jgi:histidinol-phosphate aminotransferase
MSTTINRRSWLKLNSLAAFGLGLGLPAIAETQKIRNVFNSEIPLINLGSNENPYGICTGAKQAILDTLPYSNRYAFNLPKLQHFKDSMAAYFGVKPENILATPGSTVVLELAALHFAKDKGNIVSPALTFPTLPQEAKKDGLELINVPMTHDYGVDLDGMLNAINAQTRIAYIVNPNNPTGTLLKPAAMKDFCLKASKKTVVVIDEAYIDFIDPPDNESMISLAASNPDILIARTFSKIHGMAGLRVGAAIGHPDLIKQLEQTHFEFSDFSISDLSLAAALASIPDENHRLQTKQKNAVARAYATKALEELNLHPIPSFTNFILFPLGKYEGNFAENMLKQNIILRSVHYDNQQWGRVSIGTLDEMQQFAKVMKQTWKV